MPDAADSGANALAALRAEMSKAAKELTSVGSPEDKRIAAIAMLTAIHDLIAPMGITTQPLWLLIDGLVQLNWGDIPPLFQKTVKRAGGRARTGLLRGGLQGFTLGVVRAMVACGEKPATARSKASKVLQNAGVDGATATGKITARTIQTWEEMASDNRRSVAAKIAGRFPPHRKPDDPQGEISRLLRSLDVIARQSPKIR